MTTWTAYPDGSFDLNTRPVGLKGAFPAIDGIPVRPTAISIDRASEVTTIRYTLAIGELELRLTNHATAPTLDSTIRGMHVAPRSIQVLAGARATGFTRGRRTTPNPATRHWTKRMKLARNNCSRVAGKRPERCSSFPVAVT